MASVNVQVNVLTRAADPTQHLLEEDYDQVFQLTTTDSAYTTDTSAFATTVWTYYNSEAAGSDNTSTSTVSNVELRWRVWIGGSSTSGGTTTNVGVFNTVPTGASDIQTELNKHIAYALTGDNTTPGS